MKDYCAPSSNGQCSCRKFGADPNDGERAMTYHDPLPILRELIATRYGTQAEAALRWGVSAAFVSAVMTGKKYPTEQMLDEAGLERVFAYRWRT